MSDTKPIPEKIAEAANGKVEYNFVVPGPEEAGYLKRMRAGLRFKWLVESGFADMDYRDIDEMVAFLAGYFEGIELEAAKEVLWEANESGFMALLNAILGKPTKPDKDDGDIPKESNGEPADL